MPHKMPSCTYVTDEEESQHVPQQLVNKKRKKAVIYQVYLNYEFEKFTDSYKHKKVSKYIKVNQNIYKIAISVFILINTMSVFSDFIMYYKRTLTLISTKER